jgi:beta-exotoxin I transport system permease protein
MTRGVLARSFRELERSAVGWAIAVVGVSLLYAAFYPSIRDSAAQLSDYMDKLPEAVKSVIGADYTTPAGYLRSELFSSLGIILFLIFAIGAGSRAIAGEEERRTLDLVLSTPVRRRTLITDKALAIVVTTFALATVLFVTTLAAGPLFDLSVPAPRLVGACVMLALLAIAFGAIALAIATSSGRRSLGNAVAGAIAVVSLVVNALAAQVSGLNPIRPLSPFRWYLDPDPLTTPLRPVNVLVLVGITAVAFVVALVAFDRRDLAA